MQRAFILLWTATAIVIIALMVLLYVSLIPHFRDIGDWFVWVLRLAMICGAALMLVATWAYINILLSKMRHAQKQEMLVSAPAEHHSIYLQDLTPRYAVHEVSANVVAAGVPRLLPAPSDEPPLQLDEQDIINIYNANKDITLKELAKQFDMTYNKVQKIYADAKSRGLITRK